MFLEWIRGNTPSIQAIFHRICKLSGISPSICPNVLNSRTPIQSIYVISHKIVKRAFTLTPYQKLIKNTPQN